MAQEYVFPDDWNAMTDIQALKTIEYLCANYSKYKIKMIDVDTVGIGKNIQVTYGVTENSRIKIYKINGREFEHLFDKILVSKLVKSCIEYKTTILNKVLENKKHR